MIESIYNLLKLIDKHCHTYRLDGWPWILILSNPFWLLMVVSPVNLSVKILRLVWLTTVYRSSVGHRAWQRWWWQMIKHLRGKLLVDSIRVGLGYTCGFTSAYRVNRSDRLATPRIDHRIVYWNDTNKNFSTMADIREVWDINARIFPRDLNPWKLSLQI